MAHVRSIQAEFVNAVMAAIAVTTMPITLVRSLDFISVLTINLYFVLLTISLALNRNSH
jgi:hypothetical protein